MNQSRTNSQERAAGLARIRDNQRRSRARRKEYINELEDKNRVCEQLGVEASIELQLAARAVLAENQRLRALLKRHGHSDADIDSGSLNQGRTPPTIALQNALDTKRACRTDTGSQTSFSTQPNASQSPLTTVRDSFQGNTPLDTHMTPTAADMSYVQLPESMAGPMNQDINSVRSCRDAADMLRMVHPSLDFELGEQFGCGDNQIDCDVSNDQLFQALLRTPPLS